jgi:hypothetical protein
MVVGAKFNGSDISTNIGFLARRPSGTVDYRNGLQALKVHDFRLQYALGGIECMFSDLRLADLQSQIHI